MTRFRVLLVTVGLVVVALGAVRAQDKDRAFEKPFQEGYDNQAKAKSPDEWQRVIGNMRAALQLNPTESREKIRWGGVGFAGARIRAKEVEYVPFFYLGKAHYSRRECKEALDAWAMSEEQGVVQTIGDLRDYIRGASEQCEKLGVLPSPKFETASENARQRIIAARRAAEEAGTKGRTAGDLFTTDRQSRLEQARGEIRQAESRLDAAKKARSAAEFTEVHNAAERGLAVLSKLSAELAAAIAARTTAAGDLAALESALGGAVGIDAAIEAKKAFLTDALKARRQQAREAVGRVQRVADAARSPNATGNTAAVREVNSDVSNASHQLQQVFDEVVGLERRANESRNAQAVRLAREKFSLVDKAFTTFDARNAARPASDPNLASERRTIEQRVRAARRQLETAVEAGEASGIEAATRLAEQAGGRVVELTQTFGALTLEERGVHPLLTQATRHYLNNDYEQALAVLRPSEPFPSDMLFIEHVYVFRAAALHHLANKSGAGDATLLAQAREDVAALLALNPTFEPDPRVFSPRFLAFFHAGGQSAPSAIGSVRP